jgi:hypothetical protein
LKFAVTWIAVVIFGDIGSLFDDLEIVGSLVIPISQLVDDHGILQFMVSHLCCVYLMIIKLCKLLVISF